ncbi:MULTISPECIES: VCBS repeat-containing protein [unclassified Arenibacter]|uniref:VCBS repeat-containing protein n=1 Tax=unclassified Arenibacter TaxID=2615047 RepID=UPI002042F49A|nr:MULTISPECIES: VCBS repeat-containing protein [unclassified Arenibacter]
MFTLLSPEKTNITFQNQLKETLNANVLLYEYMYNGGGVATGDFNNDGFIDLYFTSNMGENKFYINKGGMRFEDVTRISKIQGRTGPWKTGVTAVDINGDHKLDLYLCYSGTMPEEKRANQLFINLGNDAKGIPIFEEKSQEYGLASTAFSNQAYFFDYDHDGDLDMLLLNHNPKSLPILNELSTANLLKKDDSLQGVRLFRQTKGKFEDVTVYAGISGSALTYGLGIGISDLDNDGWEDVYISNDYSVPDYLYMNNKDGTFTNKLKEKMGHISHFSMGNDIADINNDGWTDIFTLDMLPENNKRQKLLLAPDKYEKFDLNLRSGFHYQYMRNMLQLNNGNGTFSEIGQFAGISNTDWSWAALLADYDNDGWKDLFVTNGYFRDYTNLDFINYMDSYTQSKERLKKEDILEIIKKMPASDVSNYMFSNLGGTGFSNTTKSFGLDLPANSNGAAYADLDNDGDLDLIVNNINQPAFIHQNESQLHGNHFLQVKLKGTKLNTQGIGTKVTLYQGKRHQTVEQFPSKGYLSNVSPVLHFGLGKVSRIDSVVINWNNGKRQSLVDVVSDQTLEIDEKNAEPFKTTEIKPVSIFKDMVPPISYKNNLSNFNDFKRQSLLIEQFSHSGPPMVKWDVDKDGLEDIFIGGEKGMGASLFIQKKDGNFIKMKNAIFETSKGSHDAEAVIFDANGDGNPDIYVASGGYHDYLENDSKLQDRLYFGDGHGNFSLNEASLPQMWTSKGAVTVLDVNQDGHPDLFVGSRIIPGRYPETPKTYLLVNDGKGNFKNQIGSIAPELEYLGMITDAIWIDLDRDNNKELVVVGHWMPITVFKISSGKLQKETDLYFDKPYSGWWNTIETGDFNKDGKPDLIIGNLGTNTQFKPTDEEPAELYYKDFDENGSVDPLFCYYIQGKSYPYLTRDELLGQLGGLRSTFTSYESYANATITDIIAPKVLSKAGRLTANHMETTLFLSNEDRIFKVMELPEQAQYAPVQTLVVSDFDTDGKEDLILLGNSNNFKLRIGKFDANYGTLFMGNGNGTFNYIEQKESGLNVSGNVQSAITIDNTLFLGMSGDLLKTYKLSK